MVKLGVEAEHARSGGSTTASGAANNGSSAKKNGLGANKSVGGVTSVVTTLKALVKDDLEKFDNEQRETCIRAGGFWRYVGRPVFERMTQIARELDWKTGMKLKDINNNVDRAE